MLLTQATHGAMETLGSGPAVDSGFGKQQEQIKAGWSLLSTLHCVLLSEKVKALGSPSYKKLQVELLAVKWQDRCLQVGNNTVSSFSAAANFPSRCGWQHKSFWWQSLKILVLRCYFNIKPCNLQKRSILYELCFISEVFELGSLALILELNFSSGQKAIS